MSTIDEQLELERTMLERGADSYLNRNKTAAEQGRGADTDYGRKLMREFLAPLCSDLQTFLDDKRAWQQGKVRPLLRKVDPEKAIYLALKCMFNSIHMQEAPIAVAIRVGGMIEDEIRFELFSVQNAEYYQAIRDDFRRKGTTDYRYKHRVLTHSANEQKDGWDAWDKETKAEVGMRLMHIVCVGSELFYRKNLQEGTKVYSVLLPSPKAEAWIKQHEEFNKFLNPERLPCIIPPDDWIDFKSGGYYSPELRNITPLLMSAKKGQKEFIREQKGNYEDVLTAINQIQSTAWEVNSEVHAVVKEVWARSLGIGMPPTRPLTDFMPPSPVQGITKGTVLTADQAEAFTLWKREASSIHTEERERVSKSYQVSRILRLANDFSLRQRFWYVWYCDFRGRLYTATAGFSPQGPDLAKGLLRFADGKPLGKRGLYWLMVHGANRYGYDKGSYDDRARWVASNQANFLAAANDPISYRSVWANADKPYQFLAFLFEFRDALANKALGLDFVSRLPIGLDGSCNGLQNFSAMLRDEVGGAATNLVPSDRPSDIYSAVARVCTGKLRGLELLDEQAERWLAFIDKHGQQGDTGKALPRSVAKRPVMTLPYGSTPNSCTTYVHESIRDIEKDFFGKNKAFTAAVYLTPKLWESIGEVVVAAKVAMKWLQDTAGRLGKHNEPIRWISPDGFPCYQGTRKIVSHKIHTQLGTPFQCMIGSQTDDIDTRKQRSAIAPNFVHSMDAAHLRTTVRLAWEKGLRSFALIHDDYGTHACDTDTLHECIREAFVKTYSEHDPLQEYKDYNEDKTGIMLADIPPRGTLDITKVRESKYFFG